LCGKLPTSMSGECKTLVDTYADQIIKMIVQDLADPTGLCKELGLCSSLKQVKAVPVKANPVTCEVCKYAMSYLDSMLVQNSTEEEVKQALDSLCGKLPTSMSGECKTLVDTYADQIIKMIVQDLADPTSLCKDLGLCSSKNTKTSIVKSNPVTCEICEMAMQYLESMLSNNSTEEEIKQGLDQLCAYLPESARGECTSLVDQYADTIVKLLLQELKPDVICKELQLCASKAKVSVVHVKSLVKANPVTCEICEMAMQYLDSMLSNNSTEEEIKQGLDQLCTYLPESVRGECTSLVDQYTDTIVKLILQDLKPDAICKTLTLCASHVKDDLPCEVCRDALEVLENIIKENRTKEIIKEGLDRLCTVVPSSISQKCDSFVEFYGSLVINMLLNDIAPEKLCKELKLCPASITKVKKTVHQPKIKNAITCEFCEYAITFLDNQLKKERTEKQIKAALENLCSYLPSSVSGQCDSMVKLNTDVLVKLLIRELDPSTICNELKACTKGYFKKDLEVKTNPVECELCSQAVKYLDSVLTTKSTEEEIKKEVISLCSHLPAAIENECDALITEYGDELIKLVVQQIQPDKICKALKIC